jgi:hypothetical protein
MVDSKVFPIHLSPVTLSLTLLIQQTHNNVKWGLTYWRWRAINQTQKHMQWKLQNLKIFVVLRFELRPESRKGSYFVKSVRTRNVFLRNVQTVSGATAKLHLASDLELRAAVPLIHLYFFTAWNEANLHTHFLSGSQKYITHLRNHFRLYHSTLSLR